MQYRPDIDGLRAVAIILVVLFHAFPQILPGGFVGVDIFFVISGYLISGVILHALENGNFSFRIFYKRRILRIFPALIALLLVCLVAGWFVLWPDEYKMLGKHVAGGATFVSNILLYGETGYFDSAAMGKFLLNLWSLGIEEQFYIVFPLFLWAAFRWPATTGSLVAALCILSFLDNIFLSGRHPEADFYLPLSRFWELLAGACLQSVEHPGLWSKHLQKHIAQLRHTPAASAITVTTALLCLFLALAICKNDEGNYPGLSALLPVLSAIAFIMAGPGCWFNKKILGCSPAVYAGKISYTLYLWHWPLLAFAYTLLGASAYSQAPALRGALVAVSALLAALTYHFIEQPIRFGSMLGKFKIAALTFAMAGMLLAGFLIWHDNGVLARMPVAEQLRYQELLVPELEDEACLHYTEAQPEYYMFCRYTDNGSQRTVALLGDSHAHAAFSGVASLGKELGFNTLLLGRFPERGGEDEVRQKAGMLNILKQKKDITDVIVILRGANYLMTSHNPGEKKRDPLPMRSYASVLHELDIFLRQITATGRKVYLVEDNPDLNANARDIMSRKILFWQTHPEYEQTPRQEALARQQEYQKMLDELASIPGVTVIKGTFDAFCPGEICPILDENGLPLYYDDDHLSQRGSQILANNILRPFLAEIFGPGAQKNNRNNNASHL